MRQAQRLAGVGKPARKEASFLARVSSEAPASAAIAPVSPLPLPAHARMRMLPGQAAAARVARSLGGGS